MVANVRRLAGGGFLEPAVCAIVLEDNPIAQDPKTGVDGSRIYFESFPENIQEVYRVNPYTETGNFGTSQPASATYNGGNWQPFNLTLNFRSGVQARTAVIDTLASNILNNTDIERILLDNEKSIRFCMALGFPLKRANNEFRAIVENAQRELNSALSGTSFGDTAALASFNQTIASSASKATRNDPPIILIQFGKWRTVRGYVSGDIEVTWEAPFHPATARPFGATVKLPIQPLYKDKLDFNFVQNWAAEPGITMDRIDIVGEVFETAIDVAERATRRLVDQSGARAELSPLARLGGTGVSGAGAI